MEGRELTKWPNPQPRQNIILKSKLENWVLEIVILKLEIVSVHAFFYDKNWSFTSGSENFPKKLVWKLENILKIFFQDLVKFHGQINIWRNFQNPWPTLALLTLGLLVENLQTSLTLTKSHSHLAPPPPNPKTNLTRLIK